MNPFDIFIIIVLSYSIIRGLFRGLVKEVSSIIGVLGGFYAAYSYFPMAAKLLAGIVKDESYLNILSFLIIFCGVLIVVSILVAFAIDAWWDERQEDAQRERILGWAAAYVSDPDWFIQKAVAWWLRDLSKRDPNRTRARARAARAAAGRDRAGARGVRRGAPGGAAHEDHPGRAREGRYTTAETAACKND